MSNIIKQFYYNLICFPIFCQLQFSQKLRLRPTAPVTAEQCTAGCRMWDLVINAVSRYLQPPGEICRTTSAVAACSPHRCGCTSLDGGVLCAAVVQHSCCSFCRKLTAEMRSADQYFYWVRQSMEMEILLKEGRSLFPCQFKIK